MNPLIRQHWRGLGVLALACLLLVAALAYVTSGSGRRAVTAEFVSATGVFPGDDVRVLGVRAGTIESITPGPESVRVLMHVDDHVRLPADAQALIIAQSLVSARFIQLTPVYTGGPELADDATIPLARTGVPVEWDEVKGALAELSDTLGPGGPNAQGPDDPGSLASIVTDASDMVAGNGEAFRTAITELSQAMSTLADGRGDMFAIVRNLQVFVSALKSSDQQIAQFSENLAGVSGVLNSNRDLLGSAMTGLDTALVDIQQFIDENGELLTTELDKIGGVTQLLTDNRASLEEILHQAPTQMANFYNIYKPAQGSMTGVLSLPNMANPIQFICGAIAGAEKANSAEASRLCAQHMGPVLQTLRMNYPDLLINPVTGVFADPGQVIYSQPGLEDTVPNLEPTSRTYSPPPLLEMMMGGAPR
ncbi:MCE family protein [Tomitella biformata]|uniref:MCE family protein n=1 Tax=Tomitella biformata TaxID=630403 RepID=UPI0004679950|nr:MCE family protein [Tomitella biformata]